MNAGAEAPESKIDGLVSLFEQGRFEETVQAADDLAKSYPRDTMLLSLLGASLGELSRSQEAAVCFQRCVELDPEDAEAHYNLGEALSALGQRRAALNSFASAADLDGSQPDYWFRLADLTEGTTFKSYDIRLARVLTALLQKDNVCSPSSLVLPVTNLLRCHQAVAAAIEWCKQNAGIPLPGGTLKEISSVGLLCKLLQLSVIPDADFEIMLRAARASLLESELSNAPQIGSPDFPIALALNCYINEHVWAEDTAETAKVAQLEARLASGPGNTTSIACLASYRALEGYPWGPEIEHIPGCAQLFETHIRATAVEAELRGSMPILFPVADEVSQAVREQYEEHPYPRWVTMARHIEGVSVPEYLEISGIQAGTKLASPNPEPEILIAGCGTGRHAIDAATRFAGAKVLAVDLSTSSLAYAKRKAREFGVTNIEFAQTDILQLGNLDRRFDVIESAGVLHHMADPMAGWRVLTGLLRPGGVMQIGLYSALARAQITEARAQISALGIGSATPDIRDFRLKLLKGDDSQLAGLAELVNIPDFYSTSDCRDMLFHVQEHCFTLPQIRDSIQSLGLEFLGFELPKGLPGPVPPNTSIDCLEDWHDYELRHPKTFLRMYQFWLRKP